MAMKQEKNNGKISKGYRLKAETHEKIKKLKNIFKTDSDYILNRACEELLMGIKKNNKNPEKKKFNKLNNS
jgi:hypothetical protein